MLIGFWDMLLWVQPKQRQEKKSEIRQKFQNCENWIPNNLLTVVDLLDIAVGTSHISITLSNWLLDIPYLLRDSIFVFWIISVIILVSTTVSGNVYFIDGMHILYKGLRLPCIALYSTIWHTLVYVSRIPYLKDNERYLVYK